MKIHDPFFFFSFLPLLSLLFFLSIQRKRENVQAKNHTEQGISFQIPEIAFHESSADAPVHRDWSLRNISIQIAMPEDKGILTSPGGLSENMTEELDFQDFYPVLRNPHIACVFLRSGLIERFSTGIQRRIDCCQKDLVKPSFKISKESVSVTLPVLNQYGLPTEEQPLVYEFIQEHSFSYQT